MTSVLLSQQRVNEKEPPTDDQLAQVETNKQLLSLHAKKTLLICGITCCEIDNSFGGTLCAEHVPLLANGGLSLLINYANTVRDMGNMIATVAAENI